MLILFLLIILLFLGLVIFAIFKFVKWTSQDKIRLKRALSILSILVLTFVIKRVFFTKMEFIHSKVYSNLYIVKNPVKDSLQVKKAVIDKIKEHLVTQHKQTKELSYSETKSIYFYEYVGMSFSFLSEAGTEYFIDHEEDLGGFVTEELSMYQEYRIGEFYYNLPKKEVNSICGELDFFHEGGFVKTDTICKLRTIE